MADPTQQPSDRTLIEQLVQQLTLTLQLNNTQNNGSSSSDTFNKVRLREPDTFTGEDCDQQIVDGWIRSIERHKEFHRWDNERTVAYAITFLKDYADIWFRTLEDQNIAPTHWIEFKDLFIAKFRPGNAYDLARDKLVNLKQTTSIQDYIKQFAQTIILIPQLHHLEAYDRFMRGLKVEHDQLFAELRAVEVEDRTIDLAYSKASAFEASHVRRDASGQVVSAPIRPAANKSNQNTYYNKYEPMDLDAIQRRNNQGNKNNNNFNNNNPNNRQSTKNNNNNQSRTYPPCKLCGKNGHSAAKCYLLPLVISAVNNAKQNNPKSSFNVVESSAIGDNNNNSNGSIDNKNNSLNHYSHVPSSSNNHQSSICSTSTTTANTTDNTGIVIEHVNPDTEVTAPSSTPVSSSKRSYPMELVPIIHATTQHQQELNYIMELNSISTSLPLYRGIAGSDNLIIRILIDNGASDNYCSSSLVDRIASHISNVNSREVETADGGITAINREAEINLNLGGYECQVSAFVFPTKFDLILGRTFLKQYNPEPNWNNDTWTIGTGSEAVRLVPLKDNNGDFESMDDEENGNAAPRKQLSYLISKKQVDNLLRVGASGFLLYMKDVLPEPTSSRDVSCDVGKEWIQKLLSEFSSIFSDALPGLPQDSGFEHVIKLEDNSKPVNRAPYKMSPAELDELKRQLEELLELGLIRPSSSPYGSPVLFVRKPDGSMRMCIDYRALNRLTIRNSNPLPRIDECFDRLQGSTFFSSIDLKSGYHQIRIQESDIPKTAFNTRYGKFEWRVLPFGLCNAPPSFQARMNEVLGDYIDKFCLVYLDDICIFSRTLEEHKEHLRLVLEQLQQHSLIVNLKKCSFMKRELEFLGFRVSDKGILPSKSKVEAIQNWKRPCNVQEVRQFVGLAQHYRRFIPLFASIASPLTDLTKGTGTKRRPVLWTPECEASFIKIKQLLTSAPVLLLPDMTKPFRIEVDCSNFSCGGVLLQPAPLKDNSDKIVWHPVAYESKKLSSAERNYPAQERELLGVIHALRTWECFIDGCPAGYQVLTDHHSLQYLRGQSKPTPRLVRWLAELESYSPEIVYKSGKTNIVPDALSRADGVDCIPAAESMEPKYLYAADLASANHPPERELSLELQQDWPLLYRGNYHQQVKTAKLKSLLEGEKDNFVVTTDHRVLRKVKLTVDKGQNDNEKITSTVEKEVPFVPFAKRVELVSKYHLGFGHAGVKNMINMFKSRYWWPTMHRDITFWIKTCGSCQVNARKSKKHKDVMHPLDVPEAFSRWHLDFIGELPITLKGNKWIITAVDSLTNWCIARSVPTASAEAVADFLYEEIVMRFGCPAEIMSDRGSNFMSNVLKSYVHRLGTNHKLTSAFHPRSNSKNERFNGILKPILRKYVNGAIHRWDDFLEAALFACRIRKHTTTGQSPFMLTYGREPRLPGDFLRPYIDSVSAKDPRTIADYTARELESLGQLRAAAEFRTKAINARDKEKWDAAIKQEFFEPGDVVLLSNEGRYGLEPLHRGPYVVLQHYPEYGTYKLETLAGKPLDSLIHADRLSKTYGEKPDEPWYEPASFLRRPVVQVNSSNEARTATSSTVVAPYSSSSRPMNRPILVSTEENDDSGNHSDNRHNMENDNNDDYDDDVQNEAILDTLNNDITHFNSSPSSSTSPTTTALLPQTSPMILEETTLLSEESGIDHNISRDTHVYQNLSRDEHVIFDENQAMESTPAPSPTIAPASASSPPTSPMMESTTNSHDEENASINEVISIPDDDDELSDILETQEPPGNDSEIDDTYESNQLQVETTVSTTPIATTTSIVEENFSTPPPAPRLRPVVTNRREHLPPPTTVIDVNMESSSTTTTPPPVPSSSPTVSPLPIKNFTFSCPVVPVESPNIVPTTTTETTQQFRFEGVPGVTPLSRGDNVELTGKEVSMEEVDMPDFIRFWNINKTKRFRPVTPSTRRMSKKRKLGGT